MPHDGVARTHTSSRFANFLYQASLGSLITLICIVLLASGYDVAQQVIKEGRGPIRFSDTAILAGAYLLVLILSITIILSRLYTVRQILASIPKGYLPLSEDELSKNLFRLIAAEYTRCAMITTATRPGGRTLPGWGAPGTPYAGLRFRGEILATLKALEAVLPEREKASDEKTPIPTASKHASPLYKYREHLIGEKALVDPAALPLVELYEKLLQAARWKMEEPTQQDYEDAARIVIILVNLIEKKKQQGPI